MARAMSDKPERKKRDFIGVQFDCCKTYTRVYLKDGGRSQIAHCPKCGKPFTIRFSPSGTDDVFWIAG